MRPPVRPARSGDPARIGVGDPARIGVGDLAPTGVGDLIGDPPTWEAGMRLALAQARLAASTDEVPVGAIVIDAQGSVLAVAANRRETTHDPTAHAEVLALRAAAQQVGSWRLPGSTLIVTLEPCTMCAGAAVLARVERIVFGAWDPKAGAVGSLWDVVRDRRLNHRPEVVAGVLAGECSAVLDAFFARRRVNPGPGADGRCDGSG